METKKFIYDDKFHPIHYRPGTSDEAIIQAVLIDKTEYVFPTASPKIIYDIGANIGVVSALLANVYPAAQIYSFEPVEKNYRLLVENTRLYPNITVRNYGLGSENAMKKIYISNDEKNHGGFSTEIKTDKWLETVQIRNINDVCKMFGVPDIIKIDVEGAEEDILTGMESIKDVDWITGELHGVDEYILLNHLSTYFKLSFKRGFGDKVWHFNAVSKAWTDFGLDK